MKTVDYKFHELCEEIDYWKDQAKYYKDKYEEEIQRSVEETNRQLEESKQGVANALMFALSVKDNEDGSLSISSEDRKQLADNFK
jgi:hypothetical protein